MEERISDTEPECQTMEGGSTVILDELKLYEVISQGSLKFDEWTSLITEIEKTYPDNIDKICLVYDSFLSEFPLCHGYWRKYADHKIRLCTVDKVVEVFERAVQSGTYCVDVWVEYCSFGSMVFEDPSDVRRLFNRALSFVGKDYLCHILWDKYIEFEFSQQHWGSLANIYLQTLKFPTKKLHCYYERFKKLVGILDKEMTSQGNSTLEVLAQPTVDSELSTFNKQDNISCIIKDLLDPSIGLARSKALKKYLFIGEQFYQDASQLNAKINCFETHIRRSYFHVKPLDANQLENWHQYLDFAESHGDLDWVVKLYERCLIPCVNYPEFWMRYVEFMECGGGREIANFALDRATKTFLKRVSVIHLFNARFKEHIGDVLNAHASLLQCYSESDSELVENAIVRANMEKRLGNFISASNTYKDAIEMAAAKEKWHILPSLYVNFSRLKYMTADSEDAAIDILIDGIKHVPCSKLLIEELIKFTMTHRGSNHITVVDSVVANALSPGDGLSQGLSLKDGEDISRLYLEFVDLCGTVRDVRTAWNRHIKLFPNSVRATFRHSMGTKQWKMAVELQQGTLQKPDTQAAHPDIDQVSDEKPTVLANHGKLSDQKSLLLENHSMESEQATVDMLQSRESDNNLQECVPQESLRVPELHEEDLSQSKVSLDSVPQVTDKTESAQSSLEFSKVDDLQQEYDHKSEENLKPPQLERLSLDPQDTKSPGRIIPMPNNSEAPSEINLSKGSMLKSKAHEENSFFNESMTEIGQNSIVDHIASGPKSTQAPVSAQVNYETASPSSASNQNIVAHDFPRPRMPANSGRNWHQKSNSDRIRRDSKFGSRGHSHRRLHQQRQSSSPRQHPQADIGSQMPKSQGFPSQPLSSQNPQNQQASQVQSHYPAFTAHGNLTASQAWPMQSLQQDNSSPACQSQIPVQSAPYPQAQMAQFPMQINDQHGNVQNNQAYNQMWQYYFYQQQQQQFLWQQQQQLQQQHPQQLQQQYQQQLLQFQYLQHQQLQLQPQQPYQLQQQQQQQLLYQQQLQSQEHQQPQLQLQQQQHHHQPQLPLPQGQKHEQEQGQPEQQSSASMIQTCKQETTPESGQQTMVLQDQVIPPHGTGDPVTVEFSASPHPQQQSSQSQ